MILCREITNQVSKSADVTHFLSAKLSERVEVFWECLSNLHYQSRKTFSKDLRILKKIRKCVCGVKGSRRKQRQR